MALKRVSNIRQPLKIGMSGVSGSGKTYSSLLLAKGFMGSFDEVGLLDSENSGSDYSNLGDFFMESIQPPFHPDRYIKAIKHFEDNGCKFLIIDSITQEWSGDGGCLSILEKMNTAKGNSFQHWAKITPLHNRFLSAIIQSNMHIIVTMRRKTDWVLQSNDKGKMQPKKVGLKEEQREGLEYELKVNFDIDHTHLVSVSKDRTSIFDGAAPFLINEKVGEALKMWHEGKTKEEIEWV